MEEHQAGESRSKSEGVTGGQPMQGQEQPTQTQPTVSVNPSGAGKPDTDQTRLWGILGYLIPVLFFVPLVGELKDNTFARFHVNQQLDLLLYWVVVNVLGMIPVIGWLLLPFGYLFGLVLMIMGIINVSQGVQKRLLLIGSIDLIK